MGSAVNHFRLECKHGRLIVQCRCPGPKTVYPGKCLDDCEEEDEQ